LRDERKFGDCRASRCLHEDPRTYRARKRQNRVTVTGARSEKSQYPARESVLPLRLAIARSSIEVIVLAAGSEANVDVELCLRTISPACAMAHT
jgi:hypothetical protein